MNVRGLAIAAVIGRRELLRFARQPARIAAAIGTPVLLWLFLGSGFAGSFRPAGLEETSYMAFLLPGMLTLVAVFTAIFSSIALIEGRQEGWLRAVVVSPAPRWSIALGVIAGAAFVAWIQSVLVLVVGLLLGLEVGWGGALLMLGALAVTSFAMAALGVAFAWRSQSTASFHAVMNLLFMPMWLLSGAFFPPPLNGSGLVASWLGWIMRINPLTWCTQAIREPMLGSPSWMPQVAACLFAAAMLGLAVAVIARPHVLTS